MLIRLMKDEIRELISQSRSKLTESDLDKMAVPSYLHKNPLIQWLLKRRLQYVVKLARLTGQESVLDFGCGIGILLPTLCAATKEVHATDLFPQIAQELVKNRKLQVTFHPSNELNVSIPNGCLDLIIAVESMEHINNPSECLQVFKNKLKEKGRLIVSGPTENIIYKLGRLVAGFKGKGKYHFLNIYDLDRIVTNLGFERLKYLHLPFFSPPYLFKIIEYQKP